MLALKHKNLYLRLLQPLVAGSIMPLGFAPFHLPGMALLGIALLFISLQKFVTKTNFLPGFIFGFAYLGVGTSWIYLSIHDYGHLHPIIAAIITLTLMAYLSCFFGLFTLIYTRIAIGNCLLFSVLWCLFEYLRSNCLGGFPWILLGFSQIDTPLKALLPIIGILGVGLVACLCATVLAYGLMYRSWRYLVSFVIMLLLPSTISLVQWTHLDAKGISVGIIQANLSMRDKWDAQLFADLLAKYEANIRQLIQQKTKIIVLPESAIPVPANYITEWLTSIDKTAKSAQSAVLVGIPQSTDIKQTSYYNTLTTLGNANGQYFKQHLVPFGEFIPKLFIQLLKNFPFIMSNMTPGMPNQLPITVQGNPIATLICYELAYPELLRAQLPNARFIVSISDDGWFGHSLAAYQQLQMAQALSAVTGRFQLTANNDGVSAVIDNYGNIVRTLQAFKPGILTATIFATTGTTPWIYMGDAPTLIACCLILALKMRKKLRLARLQKIIAH